ncbi:MAG TPA: MFS transporter [Kiloniellales bacterium]|nr:MFS transporter [Kiloniellales bacterium]
MASTSLSRILRLTACMSMNQIALTLIMTVAALAGRLLAGDQPGLATLPLACLYFAVMASSIPASMLMGRYGRKAGFALGAGCGVVAGLLGALALWQGWFWLLALAFALYGVAAGHANYYRFAASEIVEPAFRSRAISYVLAGGVIAAIAGPWLADLGKDLFLPFTFAGSLLAIACLSLLIFPILLTLRFQPPPAASAPVADSLPARPLGEIVRQPKFIVAALGAMIGYGSMNLLMVSTPLAMDGCGFGFSDSSRVIQWHVLGMYVPSFFTGHLIKRFGVLRIMAVGAAVIMAAAAINLHGLSFWHFWSALILLGVGWNFLFIGGTTLLTETYRPSERTKVQATNEFLVWGTTATTALSSGLVFQAGGWNWVNIGVLPALGITFLAILWQLVRRPVAVPTP